MTPDTKKVLVFGVFDGLHKGHKFFLKKAKKLGHYLIAVVTPDDFVKKLKNKTPKFSLQKRIAHLKKFDPVDEILVGDNEIGRWSAFKNSIPDIIAIGHDQSLLESALKKYFKNRKQKPKLIKVDSFKPHVYKSTLLNKKKSRSV